MNFIIEFIYKEKVHMKKTVTLTEDEIKMIIMIISAKILATIKILIRRIIGAMRLLIMMTP